MVSDELFGLPAETLRLFALFQRALDDLHNVFVVPDVGPCFRTWRSRRSDEEGELIDQALNQSVVRESSRESAVVLHVGSKAGQGMCLEEALRELQQPLRVIVEHATNDAAFLRAVARPDMREAIEDAERRRMLSFETSGGLPGVPSTLVRFEEHCRPERCFVIVDSDALAPGTPSEQAVGALKAAHRWPGAARSWALRRRSAENYLPEEALLRWRSHGAGVSPEERAARVEVWQRLDAPQRAHLNVKEGLDGDRKRLIKLRETHPDAVLDAEGRRCRHRLFAGISSEDQDALGPGFGRNIGKDFQDEKDWYRRNGRWREGEIDQEFTPILDQILRAL